MVSGVERTDEFVVDDQLLTDVGVGTRQRRVVNRG
jgi:hypothetical protein